MFAYMLTLYLQAQRKTRQIRDLPCPTHTTFHFNKSKYPFPPIEK